MSNDDNSNQTEERRDHQPGPRERALMAKHGGKAYEKTPNLPAEDTEGRMMKAFIGPNRAPYLSLYEAIRSGDRKAWLKGVNPYAFFAGLAWLFYRKLYIEGVALFLVILIPSLIFPDLTFPVVLLTMVVMGACANRYYIYYAQQKIRRLHQKIDDYAKCEEAVKQAGGISKPASAGGAVLFLIIVLLLITASYLPNDDSPRRQSSPQPSNNPSATTDATNLPACSDPAVKEMNRARAQSVLGGTSETPLDIKIGIGELVSESPDLARTCKTVILADGNSRTIYYDIFWKGPGNFGVRWRPAPR